MFMNGSECTYTREGKNTVDQAIPSLYPYPVEVVKKVTKPSINWEHVTHKFKFLSKDINGDYWLFEEKPIKTADGWDVTQGECSTVHSHVSFTPGTCNWEDSLITRPDGE